MTGLGTLPARRGDADEIDSSTWNDGGADTSEPDAEPSDVPGSPLDLADDTTSPDGGVEVAADLAVDRAAEAHAEVAPDVRPDVGSDLAVDVARDTRPPTDVAAEAPVDLPADTRPICAVDAGQHLCGQTCVDSTSVANCGASCVPCAVPANGSATCNGTTCGIACDPNFTPSGTTCVRSCTPTCEAGAVSVTGAGNRFTGVTAGASANAGSCGGAAAPDAVFRVVLTGASDLFVTTHGTRFDTVIYLRSGCCGDEIMCNDNADGRFTSKLNATNLPAGTYDVFVDGATAADAGAFSVDIFISPASANPGESCGRPTRIANAALAGTSCGLRNDVSPPQPTCASVDSSLDAVYYFVLDEPATVRFDTCTGTCLDTVLYVRDVCAVPATPQMCNDDACNGCAGSTNSIQSRATATLAAGVHYLVVDTLIGNACGAFTLTPQNVPE